jgi:inosose dehydratase
VIRVANAPCSWGILEFDHQSIAAPYGTVLDEIKQTGYAGTELGDWGFMPTDPAQLGQELSQRGLELVGAFVPVALADVRAHDDGVRSAVRTARLMRDAGASGAFIVLADDNASSLPEPAWITFAAGAEHVARAVREETGLRTVFHPHCGGYVETPDEIDRLMRLTDRALLGLVLDTGHIVYGGGDPLTVFEQHAERVWHVHFKDCDPAVARDARARGLGYLAAVRAQLFGELGTGAVDFAAVTAALNRQGYDGWIVVEQDVFPGYGTPKDSALRNRKFLRSLGL